MLRTGSPASACAHGSAHWHVPPHIEGETMQGIKVAGAIVGSVVGLLIVTGLIIFGSISLFGEFWGGVVGVGVVLLGMFVAIAIVENR